MGTYFSEDGRLLSYSLGRSDRFLALCNRAVLWQVLSPHFGDGSCSGGSDWRTIKLKRINTESGDTADLEDRLEHVKFSSTAWTHDNKVGLPATSIICRLQINF